LNQTARARHPQLAPPLRGGQTSRKGLFAALLSLPVVMSLSDYPELPAPGMPSNLAQCLLFVFFVTAPCLAWLFAWQTQREDDGTWARFGVNRRRLLLGSLVQQVWTLFVVTYGLTSLSCLSYYNGWSPHLGKELSVLLPVAFSWAVFLLLSLRALARWTSKWGLWLAAIGFPFAMMHAVSYGWDLDQADPGWASPHLSCSPFFHGAHLLGAFSGPLPVAGWVSFAVLYLYSALSLLFIFIRSPR